MIYHSNFVMEQFLGTFKPLLRHMLTHAPHAFLEKALGIFTNLVIIGNKTASETF